MRVAVLDDYVGQALTVADWSPLADRAEIVPFAAAFRDTAAAAEALGDFEIIVCMRERTPFPADLIARLPSLRLLVTTGKRNRSFDLAAARGAGITVCGTRGSGSPTSELTIGLMIALMRDIPGQAASMRTGGWQTRLGHDLAGKTLGLVGLGTVGGAVARVAVALDMTVLAWSQNLTDERARRCGAVRVEKAELFERADIVSIHYALSERSHHIVGPGELRRMKPSAYLVNTARAGLVDQSALLAALREKRLTGAALDVHETEPFLAENPFRDLDNVLMTPHLGYATAANWQRMYVDAVEDVLAFLDGSPVRVLT
jgi:phosphoglycerate dehydrogenase-like enzyme